MHWKKGEKIKQSTGLILYIISKASVVNVTWMDDFGLWIHHFSRVFHNNLFVRETINLILFYYQTPKYIVATALDSVSRYICCTLA